MENNNIFKKGETVLLTEDKKEVPGEIRYLSKNGKSALVTLKNKIKSVLTSSLKKKDNGTKKVN